MTAFFSRPSRVRTFLAVAAVAAAALAGPTARAAPVLEFGVGAFVSLDAGGAHWFTDASGPYTESGVILQGVEDTALGGTQKASTMAYSQLGAMGGLVQASTVGALLASAQGFNDLSWYSDLLILGTPGTRVTLRFGTGIEGMLSASALPGGAYSGGVRSTTFAGGVPLADWSFDAAESLGSFFAFGFFDHEYDVGSVVRVSSRMTVGAHADIDSSIAADAFHTSRFYVDVLTPGGGYLAGGGVVFPHLPGAGAIPEPGGVALLLAAALALGAVRSGRRRLAESSASTFSPLESSCK